MLKKQEEYLRIKPDEFYDSMNHSTLVEELRRINVSFDHNCPIRDQIQKLKHFNRERNLVCWHDSSSVSNASHFLVTINTLYDPAIFLTNQEYFDKIGNNEFMVNCGLYISI